MKDGMDWKPKKRGDTYCSPGCGGGCKHADYLKAVQMSRTMAAMMGPGWRPVVWENMGWHWKIQLSAEPRVAVHPSSGGQWLGAVGRFMDHARTPRAALRKAMLRLERDILPDQEAIHLAAKELRRVR